MRDTHPGTPDSAEYLALETEFARLRTEIERSRARRRIAFMATLVLVPLGAWGSSVSVPYVFTNGTIADADEVNANLQALANAVNDNDARVSTLDTIGVLYGIASYDASGTGTATVSCPANRVLVGGGCTDTGLGQLRTSAPSGNGWSCVNANYGNGAPEPVTATALCALVK